MTPRRAMRGQPVLVLGLLLGGWVVLRATYWNAPFVDRQPTLPRDTAAEARPEVRAGDRPAPLASRPAMVPSGDRDPQPVWVARAMALVELPLAPPSALLTISPGPVARNGAEAPSYDAPYQPQGPLAAKPAGEGGSDRWSADGWVLLRRDTTTALTSGRGSYGRSQAGAVLRFALAPSSGFRPQAYLRVSQTIGLPESEAAFGLSARPVPGVPLRAAVELRATQSGSSTLLRPAAYAVTELPPATLPLGLAAEAYAQAGYVGGSYASAFVDGQARVERRLARRGSASFDFGAGVWGGAQKGAARLDVGPSASLRFTFGRASARVSADWRFRIAGNADPASGPALTISAGF